ncbi:hypothetical protein ACSYDW_09775 [Paeniglutamicibacter sp. R2-26]|uniref:hypothetical protein n=1 Tax=Paeniglutamicibacter sp. R2-26 TaxID=3144417 RepID=UPI003EE71FBA
MAGTSRVAQQGVREAKPTGGGRAADLRLSPVNQLLNGVYDPTMAKVTFKPGDEVVTPRSRGTIIDICATPSGQFIFGVEDATGEVAYFTTKALNHAQNPELPQR